jgi:hypothetical protein
MPRAKPIWLLIPCYGVGASVICLLAPCFSSLVCGFPLPSLKGMWLVKPATLVNPAELTVRSSYQQAD